MNNLRQIKSVVYQLKRLYGSKATLVVYSDNVSDLQTGRVNNTETAYVIKKAVLMPEGSTLSLSKNLIFNPGTAGPVYSKGSRFILIEAKDSPVIPSNGNIIQFNSLNYEIKSVEIIENVAYYMEVTVIK